jgi:spermidine synthase
METLVENRLASHSYLPALCFLFFGSGCAALIYEIVWLQLLELVVGSSGVSLGVLLGTFMGGMCLGSFALPRLVSPRLHPLRVYAMLELGVGTVGIAVLFGMPVISGLYASLPWHGIFARAAVAAVCLLPSTLLMGATLPAVSRFVESSREGISWMGFFYGGNIAGAVAGCLLAGFFFLRLFDMPTAVFIAAAINGAVALIGFVLSRKEIWAHAAVSASPAQNEEAPRGSAVYIVIALSGLSALGAEVVWTRLLSLLMGGTVYTFSIILAVFLAGLGLGSGAGSLIARYCLHPRQALALCQLLLAGGVAWAAFMVARSLPYWPINPGMYTSDWGPWYIFQLDLLRAAWTVLPATLLWGASFPLAIAAAATARRDPGHAVSGVYAANTLGGILGSLGFSMWIIPEFGTQNAERVLIILVFISALIMLGSTWAAVRTDRNTISFRRFSACLGALFILVFLVDTVARIPWVLIAWGRFSATYMSQAAPEVNSAGTPTAGTSPSRWYCTYVGEGMNVSVAVTTSGGARYFHGAGKVQASSQPQDMRLQRMLGHLSALTCRNVNEVQDVLVIACGAGVTAGSFVLYPSVRRIVICDIEPLVPKRVAPMFGKENYHIVDGIDKNNPRHLNGKEITVIYDDGRHYIRTLPKDAKFDVITSDPIDPWVKGSAALNTIEFYEMCKSHLKPGGVMSLWSPLYESNLASSQSMIATFFEVFPMGMLFSNDQHLEGYDAVLLGQKERSSIDLDVLDRILESKPYEQVKASLAEVGFGAAGDPFNSWNQTVAVNLLATFAGQASNLTPWTSAAQINRDRNLRLQYLAGMWFNSYLSTSILQSILQYYHFPDDFFVGSAERLAMLKQVLSDAGRRER